jgi:hypothetical protein
MGEITVRFVGICVHLVNASKTLPPHRVVAMSNTGDVNGKSISPHQPSIAIVPGTGRITSGAFPPLNKVRISIGPIDGSPQYEWSTWRSMPSLSALSGRTPLQLNNAVVEQGQGLASVFFDAGSGTFSAARVATGEPADDQPVAAILKVNTEEDEPVLLLWKFDGSAIEPPVTFTSGTVLELTNDANGGAESEDDFLLSYDIFTSFPSDPVIPQCTNPRLPVIPRQVAGLVERLGAQGLGVIPDLTTGCSNSTYP